MTRSIAWEHVTDADVVLLAVLWQHVPAVLRAAGDLRGKVLIDCTNPLTRSDDALAVGHRISGAELVARRAPGALVVKAFNAVPSELLRAGTSVFWLLVVGIVFARAVYFEPGAFNFDRAIAWAQGLFAFL